MKKGSIFKQGKRAATIAVNRYGPLKKRIENHGQGKPSGWDEASVIEAMLFNLRLEHEKREAKKQAAKQAKRPGQSGAVPVIAEEEGEEEGGEEDEGGEEASKPSPRARRHAARSDGAGASATAESVINDDDVIVEEETEVDIQEDSLPDLMILEEDEEEGTMSLPEDQYELDWDTIKQTEMEELHEYAKMHEPFWLTWLKMGPFGSDSAWLSVKPEKPKPKTGAQQGFTNRQDQRNLEHAERYEHAHEGKITSQEAAAQREVQQLAVKYRAQYMKEQETELKIAQALFSLPEGTEGKLTSSEYASRLIKASQGTPPLEHFVSIVLNRKSEDAGSTSASGAAGSTSASGAAGSTSAA